VRRPSACTGSQACSGSISSNEARCWQRRAKALLAAHGLADELELTLNQFQINSQFRPQLRERFDVRELRGIDDALSASLEWWLSREADNQRPAATILRS
jgi:hypothetical protein